jgi:hypothetical protein
VLNGKLYGTTLFGGGHGKFGGWGTVFEVSTLGKERVLCVLHRIGGYPTDGSFPQAALIAANGALYGTTLTGGAHYYDGTVFSVRL